MAILLSYTRKQFFERILGAGWTEWTKWTRWTEWTEMEFVRLVKGARFVTRFHSDS